MTFSQATGWDLKQLQQHFPQPRQLGFLEDHCFLARTAAFAKVCHQRLLPGEGGRGVSRHGRANRCGKRLYTCAYWFCENMTYAMLRQCALHDPKAAFRREFFDLAWTATALGWQVGT